MSEHTKPEWWPTNPYFERIFTMTEDEFIAAIPDEHLRTRIAGFCMREGWANASDAIFEAWKAHIERSLDIQYANLRNALSHLTSQGADETP